MIQNEEIAAILARLETKQSVQSLLVLDRNSGSIIRSSGTITTRANDSLVNDYAAMVYKFVKSAEELVVGMDEAVCLRFLNA